MARLKNTTGKQAGKTFDLSKATIIGRGETAQVQIADTHASREHCKVFEQGGAWVVADLNSRNGFKVNGVQTTRKNLNNGDKIVIGETTLEFDAGGGAPSKSAGGESKKEAAFAAARASSAAPSRGGAATASRAAATSGEGGLKVSDRVLQYSKVDASKAGVLDVDLTQSAAMSRFLVTLACIAFLGLVVYFVIKMMA